MGFESLSWDLLYPTTSLPAIGAYAGANTEVPVFDTTKVRSGDYGFVQQDPRGTNTQSCPHLKRILLSVIADQTLSLYRRHLSAQVVGAARLLQANWDPVLDDAATPASPTVIPATANPVVIPIYFFGDDYQINLKTGATPPTFVRLSLRLSSDQSPIK